MLWIVRVSDKERGSTARYYVEHNSDRGLSDGDAPEEVLIRVFLDRQDAERYADTVSEYQQLNRDNVKSIPVELKALFDELVEVDRASLSYFGAPIRVDICEMKPDEHPKTVTTLHTAFAERH